MRLLDYKTSALAFAAQEAEIDRQVEASSGDAPWEEKLRPLLPLVGAPGPAVELATRSATLRDPSTGKTRTVLVEWDYPMTALFEAGDAYGEAAADCELGTARHLRLLPHVPCPGLDSSYLPALFDHVGAGAAAVTRIRDEYTQWRDRVEIGGMRWLASLDEAAAAELGAWWVRACPEVLCFDWYFVRIGYAEGADIATQILRRLSVAARRALADATSVCIDTEHLTRF
jgi:hypothetical protein